MNCNCNTIICSNADTSGAEVVLIPNKIIKNLENTKNYGLVIGTNAIANSNLPVFIQTGIGNIPVLCKYGNTIYANQLNKRVRYPIGYGNQNTNYELGQFVIMSCNNINQKSTTTGSTTKSGKSNKNE